MKRRSVSFLLAFAPVAFPASLIQPSIDPDGVVNGASYIRRGFQNSGIARGSIFVIFGRNLGPDTLVQADTIPLSTSNGLAGTRVHIDSAGYSADAPMLYTSANQVAAILPSSTPEGNATLTLNYNNLTSNPVTVHVVRAQPGLFTLNQGGSAQAVAQNWRPTGLSLNTLITPAIPGQPVTLWGTGLGPISGDESTALPTSFALSVDSVTVGGQPAKVTYAGRSACCYALDQISFEVPANLSGCYLPVAVVSGGVTSNFTTIAVSADGSPCNDALSFSSSSLQGLAGNGRMSTGQVNLRNQKVLADGSNSVSLKGTFSMYNATSLLAAAAAVNPSAGACYATQTQVNTDINVLSRGIALNAGPQVTTSGPLGVNATYVSPGSYLGEAPALNLPEGNYGLSGAGGADIGEIRASFVVRPSIAWTNISDYASSRIVPGQPVRFTWSGGDPDGYAAIRIESTDGAYQSMIRCNVRAAAGSFTVPDYVTRAIVSGEGSISLGGFSAPSRFSAAGLNAGTITAGSESTLKINFARP